MTKTTTIGVAVSHNHQIEAARQKPPHIGAGRRHIALISCFWTFNHDSDNGARCQVPPGAVLTEGRGRPLGLPNNSRSRRLLRPVAPSSRPVAPRRTRPPQRHPDLGRRIDIMVSWGDGEETSDDVSSLGTEVCVSLGNLL
jgi:hypothetical protein